MVSSDSAIDERIILLRKDMWGIFRIHKWVSQWDNFKLLDEQVTLAHILNVLNSKKMNVTKNEILYCFNQYYNRDYHSDKDSYLKWLYGLVDNKKTKHRVVSETKEPISPLKLKKTESNKGKALQTQKTLRGAV